MQTPRRRWGRTVYELYRRPASALGTSLVLLFLLLAVFGPWLSPYGPTQQIGRDARQAPNWEHWFGTDTLGRDVFSRIVHGTRSILSLTGLGVAIAVTVGSIVGLLSGYRGGLLDEVVMRFLDSLLAIPALLLALVLLGAVGQSRWSVLAAIAVVYVPIVARVVRSEVLSVKTLGYIEAAQLRGENLPYILFREILPSVLPALTVEAALRFSYGIFLVASLGYLGVGVRPPTPDWGLMVKEARAAVRLTPWAMYFPAGAISLLVIGVNLASDGFKRILRSEVPSLSVRQRARLRQAQRACATWSSGEAGPRSGSPPPLLQAQDLTVSYQVEGRWIDALRGLTVGVQAGETLGVVGESGSGKSTLALAIVRYLSGNGAIRSGSLCYRGESILGRPLRALGGLRRTIALIPQDPMASLNPSMRVGHQIAEVLRLRGHRERASVKEQVVRLLAEVRIPDAARVANQYPHQLSGGMQQRIAIAMALAADPQLLILDEPTTGLDVTTEAAILDLVGTLLREKTRSALYISHDLGVVARMSDRVAVLYAGEMVELGSVESVFRAPEHPYTVGLLGSIPKMEQGRRGQPLPSMPGAIPSPGERPAGCVFQPRCPMATPLCLRRPELEEAEPGHQVRCHHRERVAPAREALFSEAAPPSGSRPASMDLVPTLSVHDVQTRFPIRRRWRDVAAGAPRKHVHAVNGVSLELAAGSTLAIVGESGSGKTTLARSILGLTPRTSGSVCLADDELPAALRRRSRDVRRALQAVAQNPDQALNPYISVGSALRRQLACLTGLTRADREQVLPTLLSQVGFSTEYATRLPAQLSGGEKQRVAIARAMAADSRVILYDEPTSSLDVSVQARILNLLVELQDRTGKAYLFITHDLAVAAHLADRLAVLYLGRLMEAGTREQVLHPPFHPYTEALLSACSAPRSDACRQRVRLEGSAPSPVSLPAGCPFHPRCPRRIGVICETVPPPWEPEGHALACHIPREQLAASQRPTFGAVDSQDRGVA